MVGKNTVVYCLVAVIAISFGILLGIFFSVRISSERHEILSETVETLKHESGISVDSLPKFVPCKILFSLAEERTVNEMILVSGNSIDRDKAIKILRQVESVSLRYGFDKSTILGMIAQESRFRSSAKSIADAKGLMQVTPIALSDYNKHNGTSYTDSDLSNDEVNIEIGCWTLMRQSHYLHTNDMNSCIISYNSGATNFKNNRESYLQYYDYLNKVREFEKTFKEKLSI